MTNQELINEAKKVMENAYVPYSNFQVGAALLTKSGKVYRGCNVENASYGATNCAERTAIFSAIADGEREFDKIAIVSSSNKLTPPCGICRQVMIEFSKELEILLEDDGNIKSYKIAELIPEYFVL